MHTGVVEVVMIVFSMFVQWDFSIRAYCRFPQSLPIKNSVGDVVYTTHTYVGLATYVPPDSRPVMAVHHDHYHIVVTIHLPKWSISTMVAAASASDDCF